MSQEQTIFTKSKPVFIEGFLAILLGFAMVASITATDISFHDDYVLNILSWCNPENQDAFCTDFREKHELGITEQLGIGDKYWERLASQAIEVFAIMFLARMIFAYMLQISARKKIRITSILIALVWGASATTLFMFGVLDTMYYLFQEDRDFTVPTELNWLNEVGVFQETKAWFGDPNVVDSADLFATNLVGIGILVSLVFLTAFVFNENKLFSRGIA
jgi:hypothetical protein